MGSPGQPLLISWLTLGKLLAVSVLPFPLSKMRAPHLSHYITPELVIIP